MFYPRNPIIFPPKLAGPFCRAWGLINQHHNQKSMVSFPNSLPSATSRTVHRYTAIKLLKTKIHNMQITFGKVKNTTFYVTGGRKILPWKVIPHGPFPKPHRLGTSCWWRWKGTALGFLAVHGVGRVDSKGAAKAEDFGVSRACAFTSTC